MLREMRPSELAEWRAFWDIAPWGDQRADLRGGILAALIANVHRDGKKRPQGFKPVDFMPFYEKPEEDVVTKVWGALKPGALAKKAEAPGKLRHNKAEKKRRAKGDQR